jgi:hypothetical protein
MKSRAAYYKTVWVPDGKVSFSVSRVNKWLGYYFVVFWIVVALYAAWKYACYVACVWAGVAVSVSMIVIVGVGIFLLCGQTTDLSRGTLPTDADFPGADVQMVYFKLRRPKLQWWKRISGAGSQAPFIRRKAPDE